MADYVGVEYQDVLDIIKSAQRDLQNLRENIKDRRYFDAATTATVDDIITKVATLNKQAE